MIDSILFLFLQLINLFYTLVRSLHPDHGRNPNLDQDLALQVCHLLEHSTLQITNLGTIGTVPAVEVETGIGTGTAGTEEEGMVRDMIVLEGMIERSHHPALACE